MDGRLTKIPRVLEVIWRPPLRVGLRSNTDGVAFEGPSLPGCANVFRTFKGFVNGCFAILLGVCFAFESELVVCCQRDRACLVF